MNKEEIIELVKYGCDPELIAFEFNVPIDEIKKVIDTEAKKTFLSRESKMNKIRVKYFYIKRRPVYGKKRYRRKIYLGSF